MTVFIEMGRKKHQHAVEGKTTASK